MAVSAADRVVAHLNIPVTIVTDDETADIGSHARIVATKPVENLRKDFTWYNLSRTDLYDISPYSRTLLIDSDYYICTPNLLAHINSNADFIMTRDVYNVRTGSVERYKLGNTQIDMYWATVAIFNKCEESKNIFEMAKHVQKHYVYYSELYGFKRIPVRNDYIFTIACHLIGGYGMRDYGFKNYSLVNCDNFIKYISLENDKLVYYYESTKLFANKLQNLDLHLMNKGQL
jgi:hypothetical protein